MVMRKCCIILLVFLAPNLFAMQKHLVKDDNLTTLSVSQTAFNEIGLTGDHILSVQWEGDNLEYKKDEGHDKIYVKPKSEEFAPIRLTITTKNKHRLVLLLIPANIPAEEVTLVVEANKTAVAVWEKTTPYEQAISQLIAAMYQGEFLPGFEVNAEKVKAAELSSGLKIKNAIRYYGDKLTGEILEVENSTTDTKYLTEQDFSGVGVRAVGVAEKILLPKNNTRIFRVLING